MQNIGDDILRWVLKPRVRYVLAWMMALATTVGSLFFAWHAFDVKDSDGNYRRPDRNNGHAQIDFANQWLMGRMLVKGYGQRLYHRGYLREVLREGYPRDREIPAELRKPDEIDRHDLEDLMGWMVGHDDDPVDPRGGPLYPPTGAFLYAPLGLWEPQPAYRVVQVLHLLLAFAAGLGICRIAPGRIWWPVAVSLILIYPGFRGSINLGQNAALSLTILTWGWFLIAGGQAGWGGLVWALF